MAVTDTCTGAQGSEVGGAVSSPLSHITPLIKMRFAGGPRARVTRLPTDTTQHSVNISVDPKHRVLVRYYIYI